VLEKQRDRDMLEREVESHLERQVRDVLSGECVKFIPDYKRGFPDRLVILPGERVVWVETKRPQGGKVSGAQRVAHAKLRRLGHRVEVVWTKEQADDLVARLASEIGGGFGSDK